MTTVLYKIIWTLIMMLIEIYERMYFLINLCKCKVINVFYYKGYSTDYQYLRKCLNDLDKIPQHLSIIIGTERINSEILSKIIVYALMTNIKYISFYDIKEEYLIDRIKIPKFISIKKIQNNRYLWSMATEKYEYEQKSYKNGLEKSIEIINLTPNDGKPLIIEICKKLCTHKNSPEIQEALKFKETFAKKINEMFQKHLNYLPDPDIAIVLDRTICTFGFLPWHTGFTEFHNIDPSINYFDVKMFSKILYKFSKCEQRFGK